MTPLGADSWKPVFGFLWPSSHIPFPLTDAALCLSSEYILAVIMTMCQVVSSPSPSVNLKVGRSWGPPC